PGRGGDRARHGAGDPRGRRAGVHRRPRVPPRARRDPEEPGRHRPDGDPRPAVRAGAVRAVAHPLRRGDRRGRAHGRAARRRRPARRPPARAAVRLQRPGGAALVYPPRVELDSVVGYGRGMDLHGAAAIVTGGASGLGEATARELARIGATVLVADINAERGKKIADEIGGVFAQTDVADEASVQAAVDAAVATGKPLRAVINCAGIGWAERTVNRDGSPHSLASYRKVIDVNLIGTFNFMRIGAAAMAKTDPVDSDNSRGVIINTSSVAGIEGQTGQVAYSASKGGIIGMTLPAARDLSVIGVRVLTICPGIIDTPIYGTIGSK